MQKNEKSNSCIKGVAKNTRYVLVFWTLILAGLLIENLVTHKKTINKLATIEVRTHFQKDKVFLFWSASHGGFYIPVSERTTPSPYLSHINERDIETLDSVHLTLMNPAWALRQINEDYSEAYGVFGHITSLLPLRKQNAPDEWERKALELFESGETEVLEFMESDSSKYLRLMQPLIVKESCLKCHSHQGYKVGDVRGGVSIIVPLTTYLIESRKAKTNAILSFSLIWLIGFIAIVLAFRFIKKNIIKREHAKVMLEESYSSLEKSIDERTAELRSAMNFSENLLDTANVIILNLDKDGNVTLFNKYAEKISGYKRIDVIGKNFFDFFIPESESSTIPKVFSNVLNEMPEFYSHENFILCKDGSEKLISWENTLLKNNEGEISGVLSIGTDITEKKQEENEKIVESQKLKELFDNSEKQRLATLSVLGDLNETTENLQLEIAERKKAEQIQKVLYNISNAVITTDNLVELISIIKEELGTIVDTTNFYIALYDKKTESLTAPFHVDEKDKFTTIPAGKTLTKYVVDTKKPLLANINLKKKLVKEGKLEYTGSLSKIWLGVPLKIEGIVTGVIAVQSYTDENAYGESDMEMLMFIAHQISISIDRKKAEEDLIIALEKATESDHLKSAFLATMSHELRTPLNAIIGFSDLIDEKMSVKTILEFCKIINTSGNHLLSIVEDLFDITLIESGEIKMVEDKVVLQSVMNNVHEIIKAEQQQTDKENIDFSLIIPPERNDLIIKTDSSKLKQILINLLKNALKFTQEGHIKYGYSIEKEQGRPVLKFYVEDTGIGIPKDKQEIIFEIFRQGEDSLSREYGGTGIGLSISKKLVELLGGKIWIESEKGTGSTFYFTILLNEFVQINYPTKEEPEKKKTFEKQTILIVEDDISSFEYLEAILSKPGINLIWAKNGEDSITLCKENTTIDLVLMDINMPVMDGLEATKAIKKFRPELPIIAQTARAIAGDHEKILDAGCDDYISKPIKKEKLMAKIGRLLEL